jgi:hypothetical protein
MKRRRTPSGASQVHPTASRRRADHHERQYVSILDSPGSTALDRFGKERSKFRPCPFSSDFSADATSFIKSKRFQPQQKSSSWLDQSFPGPAALLLPHKPAPRFGEERINPLITAQALRVPVGNRTPTAVADPPTQTGCSTPASTDPISASPENAHPRDTDTGSSRGTASAPP